MNVSGKIKWVWFDLDDTLFDFSASSLIVLNSVYADFGLDRWFTCADEWVECYHRHNACLWNLYNRGEITSEYLRMERFLRPFAEAGMDLSQAKELACSLDGLYLERLAATGLEIKGAKDTIMDLRKKGYRIGVLSNGFTGVQEAKLRNMGMDTLVDCLVLSDEAGINKPARGIFDYALRKSAATAAESLMIGDNPDTDIAGALAAGWQVLLFNPRKDSLGEITSFLLD